MPPLTGEAERALAPMPLSEEFFLWAASRDGDTTAVAAFLRNLGGLHIDDPWLGWTSLLKASENNRPNALVLRSFLEQSFASQLKQSL